MSKHDQGFCDRSKRHDSEKGVARVQNRPNLRGQLGFPRRDAPRKSYKLKSRRAKRNTARASSAAASAASRAAPAAAPASPAARP